jgi:FlaA1/EpsC-like NDP-sugar epimerase
MLTDKKILLFGGSGSLGNAFVQTYMASNKIIVYSRDEAKHWKMSIAYKSDNIDYIIGDIRNKDRVETSILRSNPNIIVIASALKHIDRCEYAVSECAETNFLGTQNVLDAVEKNAALLTNLECVVFISTDKACEPTNAYGMCKALSECSIVEKALHVSSIKFVSVRYGNVLNSNGSIIQILDEMGRSPVHTHFMLTDTNMSRFVMTLDQSVALIEYAITHGQTGEIIIPELVSLRVKDLVELYSEKYNKPVSMGKIRPGEKLYESLISLPQSSRTFVDENKMYHITPAYRLTPTNIEQRNYNSTYNLLSKEDLALYLKSRELL